MLNIAEDAIPKVWVEHEETRTSYFIVPIEPKDGQRLLKQSRDKKTGELDNVKYNGLAAAHMIKEWKGVGANGVETACTDEAKVKFGERFVRIVSFLIDRATDMKLFSDEAEAGKNA